MNLHPSLILFSSLLLTVVALGVWAKPPEVSWHTLNSDDGEYSIALPSGYLAQKQTRWNETTLFGGASKVTYTAGFRKTSHADITIRDLHKEPMEKGEHLDYLVGKSKVHVNSYQGKKVYRITVVVATKKGYYELSVLAASATDPILVKMLASLSLDNQPMMKSTGGVSRPVSERMIDVKTLESSPLIKEALERNQTEPITLDLSAPRSDFEEEEFVYTRPLIIVDKPRPLYTDDARRGNIQGAVVLRVLFKANGQLGPITLVKGLRLGLNETTVEAAKKLKFIPAEIDGRPVDVDRNIVYNFTIY